MNKRNLKTTNFNKDISAKVHKLIITSNRHLVLSLVIILIILTTNDSYALYARLNDFPIDSMNISDNANFRQSDLESHSANASSKKFVEGEQPYGQLCKANNGKFYGMTYMGGVYNMGLIFEWDPVTNVYIKRYDFDGYTTGSVPMGSLIMISDSIFYGMTSNGGIHDGGVIFEWNIRTNSYTKKYDFNRIEDGGYPQGNLIQAANGKLYGMTLFGGTYDKGVIFEFDPSTGIYTKKIEFDGAEMGGGPYGQLVEVENGLFYGLTERGGMYDRGVIFKWVSATNTYKKLFDFNPEVSGSQPRGSLFLASNNKLYGTTSSGGKYDNGVLFEWDYLFNRYTKKLDFFGSTTGNFPIGSLTGSLDGKIYGVTNVGGFYNAGVIYEFDINTSLCKKRIDFTNKSNSGYPYESIVLSDNGKFYGMTPGGGAATIGVLYEWDPVTNVFSEKLNFTNPTESRWTLAEACQNYTSPSGKNKYSVSGYYKDTLDCGIGCSSVIIIILNIGQLTKTICTAAYDSYTSPSGKYIWTESGNYTDTIPGKEGCDSIISIDLTILPKPSATRHPLACHSYTSPSGKYTWYESGTYSDTVATILGDQILTVELNLINLDPSVIQDRTVLVSRDELAHHQWIDCGNENKPIIGETFLTYTAEKEGNYAVIVSYGWCTDTSECMQVDLTDIPDNLTESGISLYPNPTTGKFTVNLGSIFKDAMITINELNGRLISKEQIKNRQVINMEFNAPAGVYLLNVTTKNRTRVFKIVKN